MASGKGAKPKSAPAPSPLEELDVDALEAVVGGLAEHPDAEALKDVEVPAALAELERRAVDDLEAAAALERLAAEAAPAAVPVGVHVVTAGELVAARAAGTVVANAAGDAMLERDPNSTGLRDGDLVIVSVPRGQGQAIGGAIRRALA